MWRRLAFICCLSSACGGRDQGHAEALAQSAQARADSLAAVLKQRDDSARAARDQQRLAEAQRADSIRQERMRPRELALFTSTGTDIPANGYQAFGVTVGDAGTCSIHGRIEVTHGGNLDIEVLVLLADEFTNWKNSSAAKTQNLFHAGPQTITNFQVVLPQAGTYQLVLSNRFSVITSKIAKGQVTVTCIGEQPQSVS